MTPFSAPSLLYNFVLVSLCPFCFFIPRVAPFLLILAGVGGWFFVNPYKLSPQKFMGPWFYGVLFLILWVGCSCFWSVDPVNSFKLFLRLCSLCGLSLGWYFLIQKLPPDAFRSALRSLLWGILLALTLLLMEKFLGEPWRLWCGKSCAQAFVPLVLTISASLWPCLRILSSRLQKMVFIVGIFGILSLVDCDTAWIAVILGLIASLASLVLPCITKAGLRLLAILTLALPWLFSVFLTNQQIQNINHHIHSYSYIHRLYIWQFTSQKVTQQSWILGCGADSSREDIIGGSHQEWPMVDRHHQRVTIHSKAIPTHPHNFSLQLWLELGLMGALLGASLYNFAIPWICRSSHLLATYQIGFIMAISTVFWVNLGCWQTWWLATLGILIPLFRQETSDHS